MSIIWYMFTIMKRFIARRNSQAGDASLPHRILRAEDGASSIPRGEWMVDVRKLPRLSWVLACPLDETPGQEPWKRLRWWSYGAFGNKGRLEGGQYLAGRRAPPFC